MKRNKINICFRFPKYWMMYEDISAINNEIQKDVIGPLLKLEVDYITLHEYAEKVKMEMYLNDTLVQKCNLAQFIQNLKQGKKTIMTSLYQYALNDKTTDKDIESIFQLKLDLKIERS